MSVSIEVCKDVEQFQESVAAGMDARHTVFALAGIAAGSVAGFVSHLLFHMNYIITMYVVMFAAVPVIFIGFLDKDGMGILERIKKSRALKKGGTLYDLSTESPEYFAKLLKRKPTAVTAAAEETVQMEDMKRKLILLSVFGAVLVVVLAAAAILLL